LVALVGVIAATFVMTRGQSTATIIKPGKLITPHAQILAGTLTSQRCGSCHPRAATSPNSWFSDSEGHAEVSQSDRCLDCHHTTIQRSAAKLAHNLPQIVRAKLRLASATSAEQSWHDLMPGPAVDQENVQCSVCHREHRGADGDLMAVSDAQCQSCHSDRFGSFATSHPEWDRWPYGRGRQISFNHSSHANQHFPATVRGTGVAQFQCADCHLRTADNELTRSTSYARACKSCHDDALRIEAADGVELLALPTLPAESAGRIQPWPESATGFYDGKLSPIADLLLRSDPETASALRRLPDRDFSRIDGRNPDNVADGETVARAHRQLLQEIGEDGQQVIIDRATLLGVAPSTLASFIQSLSPQFVMEANRRWFDPVSASGDSDVRQVEFQDLSIPPASILLAARPDDELLTDASSDDLLLEEPSSDGDLLGGDLLDGADGDLPNGDPLAQDPLASDRDSSAGRSKQFNADKMMPAGGWFRDDLRLAIRYRGGGHADTVLKSAIEMISQLPSGDPARQQLLQTRAVATCVACHPGAVLSGRGWRSEPLIGRRSEFTKFSHSPHLNVAQLADCSHCHSLGSDSNTELSLVSGAAEIHDFAPLRRQACAACHTPHAAGEACVDCHRYHIDLR
jgi:Zn finger protein HypA/HybF involved in hydrogenase expression